MSLLIYLVIGVVVVVTGLRIIKPELHYSDERSVCMMLSAAAVCAWPLALAVALFYGLGLLVFRLAGIKRDH